VAAAIFVSYSSLNAEEANRLVEFLEGKGYKCWIAERDEDVGADYRGPIMAALEAAEVVILLLSEAANRSPEVHNEVVQATRMQKLLIPIQLETVALSAEL
jgi:hypothetical protein